jgi:hypothetical protein
MKANEPSNLTDTVDKAELVRQLRDAAKRLDLPPSIQSQRNLRSINAMHKAADFIASHTEGAGAEPVAWQWSDFSGKWYTVDTARLSLGEQEELARDIAKKHEGRVRPLYAPTLPGDVVVESPLDKDELLSITDHLMMLADIDEPAADEPDCTDLCGNRVCDQLGCVVSKWRRVRAMIAAAPIPTPEGKVADADGWIEWKGGKCPVDPRTLVQVRFRNMPLTRMPQAPSLAHHLNWRQIGVGCDIIAYRIAPPSSERE